MNISRELKSVAHLDIRQHLMRGVGSALQTLGQPYLKSGEKGSWKSHILELVDTFIKTLITITCRPSSAE